MPIPVGLLIKSVREELGFPLREVASQLGVSPSFLYKFEEFQVCMGPLARISKSCSFDMVIEKFLVDNVNKIENKELKDYTSLIINSNSVTTNLFQDCFFFSSLDFIRFALIRIYEKYYISKGGLFDVLKKITYCDNQTAPEPGAKVIGIYSDHARSFFLTQAFNDIWGEKRTKRKKSSKHNSDIVFKPIYNNDLELGYIKGEGDFLDRVFYDETFACLILYLLLNKFCCSFFVNNNNDDEQHSWDLFRDAHAASDSKPIFLTYTKVPYPPYRDVLVVNSNFGVISICCRSLIAGYDNDIFVVHGDVLLDSKTALNLPDYKSEPIDFSEISEAKGIFNPSDFSEEGDNS